MIGTAGRGSGITWKEAIIIITTVVEAIKSYRYNNDNDSLILTVDNDNGQDCHHYLSIPKMENYGSIETWMEAISLSVITLKWND